MTRKPQVGDVVHVKGVAERVGQGLIAVSFGDRDRTCADVWISVDDIVHVERAPLKVGDAVVWRGDAANGTIIAIDTREGKTMAWIRATNTSIIVFLDELERA